MRKRYIQYYSRYVQFCPPADVINTSLVTRSVPFKKVTEIQPDSEFAPKFTISSIFILYKNLIITGQYHLPLQCMIVGLDDGDIETTCRRVKLQFALKTNGVKCTTGPD